MVYPIAYSCIITYSICILQTISPIGLQIEEMYDSVSLVLFICNSTNSNIGSFIL